MMTCHPSIQKQRFENEEFFQRYSLAREIKYVGLGVAGQIIESQDILLAQFDSDCRLGLLGIVYVPYGLNLHLDVRNIPEVKLDLYSSPTRAVFETSLVLNGVCIELKGWLNKRSLTGQAQMHFDEALATRLWKQQEQSAINQGWVPVLASVPEPVPANIACANNAMSEHLATPCVLN